MKVFVTSDIHGRFDVLGKIVEFIKEREDVELIILCGDITGDHLYRYFFELEDQQFEDYKKLKEMLRKLNRKVLFIQGNHDVFNVDKEDDYYLPNCKDEALKNFLPIEYLNFSMYGTKREGNEEDMAQRLSKIEIDENSIIVSHLPPYKCLDSNIYKGSEAIRKIVKDKKPAYFFCGHVHAEFGVKKLYNTYVFNAACDEITTRGWIVELENGKYEKIIL
jgi:Icc-related predicted phosphoesterase